MTEPNVILARCGEHIAMMCYPSEVLLTDGQALGVAEEIVARLSRESLQLLGCRIQEVLNEGLGHKSETKQ
jgi:hypothetical protein